MKKHIGNVIAGICGVAIFLFLLVGGIAYGISTAKSEPDALKSEPVTYGESNTLGVGFEFLGGIQQYSKGSAEKSRGLYKLYREINTDVLYYGFSSDSLYGGYSSEMNPLMGSDGLPVTYDEYLTIISTPETANLSN